MTIPSKSIYFENSHYYLFEILKKRLILSVFTINDNQSEKLYFIPVVRIFLESFLKTGSNLPKPYN